MKAPDFEIFCQDFDLLCFTETKLDQFDSLLIKNFVELPPVVRNNCKSKSGGIAVYVKNHLFDFIDTIKSESENILWFTFKNGVFSNPILFGVVYIPPEGSIYGSVDLFDSIENELIKFSTVNNYQFCLIGDFNAHTNTSPDFVKIDDHICKSLNLDRNSFCILNQNFLESNGFLTSRHSLDKSPVNSYGKRLLSICKSLDIHIVNGRIGKDSFIGKTTCKGATVVDYCIASTEVFNFISDFDILPFDPMTSDVHNGLIIKMDCLHKPLKVNNHDESVIIKPKWNKQKSADFVNKLNEDSIDILISKLDTLDINNVDQDIVENIVEDCNSILRAAADQSGMIKIFKQHNSNINSNNKTQKPWFNGDCAIKRKNYHKAKNWHWRNKTAESKRNLVRCSKEYKKVLNKSYNDYKKNFIDKIKNLEHSDPKSFWGLINNACSNPKNSDHKVELNEFFEHFKKLNESDNQLDEDGFHDIDFENISEFNTELNSEITTEEVAKAIQSLKNNKACGNDLIINEFLKISCEKMLNIYSKIFNIVFTTGIIPNVWSEGVICTIYKNKGDITNPDNYRGITILSCFGKLFTAVLNNRLNLYLENMNLLCEEQAGFRKNYSTVDHIFNLKCLIDLYLQRKKPLFCAFIDYKKAFDSVNRIALWHKLLNHSIDGKFLKVIKSMYNNAKSCVRQGNNLSEYFYSNVGVRQGENLSPVLFSLFLNDLVEFISRAYDGLTSITEDIHFLLSTDEVEVFLKLYLLLYADDTVVLAESAQQLQAGINAMFLYCQTWKLQVNAAKTKVVIFSHRKLNHDYNFVYNGERLAIVDEFVYLGITFSSSGSFLNNTAKLLEQGRKAMFCLLKKIRALFLPIDIQLKLFDSMVAPILLYGSEVWGFGNNRAIESLFLQFYKIILNMKKSTPDLVLLGELGRFPSDIFIKCRMIGFWKRILSGKKDKISHLLYSLLYKLHEHNIFHSKWVISIKNILNDCGMSEFWLSQSVPRQLALSRLVKCRLMDQFKQNWCMNIFELPKALNYRIYKVSHNFENYLTCLPADLRRAYSHFRCMNHKLPIEKGRFWGVSRDDRICDLCNMGNLGDEFHYIFECSFFSTERKKLVPHNFIVNPNSIKFCDLFNTDDYRTLFRLAKFCKIILSVVK